MPEATLQTDLFESAPDLPEGMRYEPAVISPSEERALLEKIPDLPFKEFEFHGFLGKRRTVSFGWHYDFNGGGLKEAGELPEFLLSLRNRAAEYAALERHGARTCAADRIPTGCRHRMAPGPSAIRGRHRDFAACTVHLPSAPQDGHNMEPPVPTAEPRSAYLLRGESRTEWEHSIPPLQTLRYSVTFRTLRETASRPAS